MLFIHKGLQLSLVFFPSTKAGTYFGHIYMSADKVFVRFFVPFTGFQFQLFLVVVCPIWSHILQGVPCLPSRESHCFYISFCFVSSEAKKRLISCEKGIFTGREG